MAQPTVALQLYTVRDQLAQDYVGTLRKVKEIGYDIVQLVGQMPYDAPEMRELLDDIGLSPAGIHIDLTELEANIDRWIEFCKTVGTVDLVCPFLPEQRRRTPEDWLGLAGLLDQIGARCCDCSRRSASPCSPPFPSFSRSWPTRGLANPSTSPRCASALPPARH